MTIKFYQNTYSFSLIKNKYFSIFHNPYHLTILLYKGTYVSDFKIKNLL